MIIRAAHQQDALLLSELIYASGSQVLESVFSINDKYNTRDFLLSALRHADGQYGFANHWLAVKNGQIMGAISAWHTKLNPSFHQATLHSVVAYFGLEHSIDVVARSQIIKHFIPAPQDHEWCIGHLAVSPQYQRQGVATQLLEFMAKLARFNAKTTLSLDVSQDNAGAIQFYQQLGFSLQNTSELTTDMRRLSFNRHLHMQKQLKQPLV